MKLAEKIRSKLALCAQLPKPFFALPAHKYFINICISHAHALTFPAVVLKEKNECGIELGRFRGNLFSQLF